MIESVVGKCGEYVLKDGEKAKSPGMKYKHYSPDCDTLLFSFEEREEAVAKYRALNGQGNNAYILCDDETFRLIGVEKGRNLGESA